MDKQHTEMTVARVDYFGNEGACLGLSQVALRPEVDVSEPNCCTNLVPYDCIRLRFGKRLTLMTKVIAENAN